MKPPTVPRNAQMVNEQRSRIDDALASLVKLYLPLDPDEDEEATNDRREGVHGALRCVLEERVSLSGNHSQSG